MKAYRIYSSPGGMHSLAATTPEEAGNDVARALARGAMSVEVEAIETKDTADLEDAWGCSQFLTSRRPQAAAPKEAER